MGGRGHGLEVERTSVDGASARNALKQFVACLASVRRITGQDDLIRELSTGHFEARTAICRWYDSFVKDIVGGRDSYPSGPVRKTPDLEDQMLRIAQSTVLLNKLDEVPCVPTLFLSHDMDYLRRTVQMAIKNVISQKRLVLPFVSSGDYMDAVAEMLAFDASIVTDGLASSVFVAAPAKVHGIGKRMKQWLIDPSYSQSRKLFAELLRLTKKHRNDVGLHGSYYSISEGLLPEELATLSLANGGPLHIGRQHWLNMTRDPMAGLSYLQSNGIEVDSSLGWNGTVGFRCGMARPFPICLADGAIVTEVPLVLMDRPLLADMKLSREGALGLAKRLLEQVYRRKGGVAICWHDAAAHPDFGWFDIYRELVEWAANRGFRFSTLSALSPSSKGSS